MFKKIFLFTAVLCFLLAGTTAKAVDPNLLAHYEFEGNANDSSGNNFNGTASGDTHYVTGKVGQAVDFDGVGDYIAVTGAITGTGVRAFTIAVWLNYRAHTSEVWAPIFAHDGWAYGYVHFQISREYGDVWVETGISGCEPDPPGYYNNFGSEFTYQAEDYGVWHHIAAVYDADAMTFDYYIDGAQDLHGTYTATVPATISPGRMGEWGGRTLNGLLDDLRIYNRALSLEEVRELLPPDPNARWPEPEDSATEVGINPTLSWTPGDYVQSTNEHELYFSTNLSEVVNRTAVKHVLDINSYTPPQLSLTKTYYWCVDEVNGVQRWYGDVWSFSTKNAKATNPSPGHQYAGVPLAPQKSDGRPANMQWRRNFPSAMTRVISALLKFWQQMQTKRTFPPAIYLFNHRQLITGGLTPTPGHRDL